MKTLTRRQIGAPLGACKPWRDLTVQLPSLSLCPAENLDVLLKGRTPVGERMLPIPSAPAALGGGAPRHHRSRSVELPSALLARPGSPFLHKVERPVLKLRPGGRPAVGPVAATAARGLALMERSHSSPVLQGYQQQQYPQQQYPQQQQYAQLQQQHWAQQDQEPLSKAGQHGGAYHISVDAAGCHPAPAPAASAVAAATAAAEGARAAAAAAAAAVGAPDLRRLTSNHSEATGGGASGSGGSGSASLGGPAAADDLEWLIGKHPASAAEAREFEMLFSGAGAGGFCAGGAGHAGGAAGFQGGMPTGQFGGAGGAGATHPFAAHMHPSAMLAAGGMAGYCCGGSGAPGLSPSAGLLFSPGAGLAGGQLERSGLFSPRFRMHL